MPFNMTISGYALQVIPTAALNVPGLIVLTITGILIGNQARSVSISHIAKRFAERYQERIWQLQMNMRLSGLWNHILNAVLFALVGLEIIAILLDLHYVSSVLLSIPAVMFTSLF